MLKIDNRLLYCGDPFDVRYCAGHDAQLEKALEYLVEQVAN